MPNETLVKYIKDGLAIGRTEDVLRPLLTTAGWTQKDIDEAFNFIKTEPTPATAQQSVQPTTQTQTQVSTEPAHLASPSPAPKAKILIVAALAALAVVLGGGWAVYAYFIVSSPQQVLAAMFQKGFEGIHSMDTNMQLSLDMHLTAASTTLPFTAKSASVASGYPMILLGGMPSELGIQIESSGTMAIDASGNRNFDQHAHLGLSANESNQNMSFALDGEGRVVGGVTYINISTFPNFGFFDLSSLEGKWIKIEANTSTKALAQNITGTQSLTLPSTTLSNTDSQRLFGAIDGVITITKTLPNETIGGVSNNHYGYSIDKAGIKNVVNTLVSIADEKIKTVSSTASIDATTTVAIDAQVSSTLSAFTSMGGELWIGKSDHYPHQFTLTLAFASSTPEAGMVNGTLNVTSTLTNINGGQVIEAPSGAEDIQTLLQSMFSPTSTAKK